MTNIIAASLRGTRSRPLPPETLAQFAGTLAELLDAGIDLPWALDTLSGLTRNATLREACREQSEALMDGRTWSDVLAESIAPRWPEPFIAWVRVAQQTGALTACLQFTQQEWADAGALSKALTRKLAYPFGVLCLSLTLAWFTGLQFGARLATLIGLTTAVVSATTLLAAIALYLIHRRGGIAETLCWSRCTRALVLATEAGLAWPVALQLLLSDLHALWNTHPIVGEQFSACLDSVHEGQQLTECGLTAGFPLPLQNSLHLARMTGDLPSALKQAVRLFDIHQRELRQRLLAVLPSAAMAIAAATLAAQYALFIQPLYEQMGAL